LTFLGLAKSEETVRKLTIAAEIALLRPGWRNFSGLIDEGPRKLPRNPHWKVTARGFRTVCKIFARADSG
jgi:hypothetical protein